MRKGMRRRCEREIDDTALLRGVWHASHTGGEEIEVVSAAMHGGSDAAVRQRGEPNRM
jgi:hypothetical protein